MLCETTYLRAAARSFTLTQSALKVVDIDDFLDGLIYFREEKDKKGKIEGE